MEPNKTIDFKDIQYLRDQARERWKEVPAGACLPGKNTAMTEPEILAMAWFQASMDLLARKGLKTDDIEIRLDNPSSEPDTD
jgi:hypothetical protein